MRVKVQVKVEVEVGMKMKIKIRIVVMMLSMFGLCSLLGYLNLLGLCVEIRKIM